MHTGSDMFNRQSTANSGTESALETMRYVVTVADFKAGKDGDVLVTHALGSCLGLMAYDPEAKIGGLLHAMLPLSKINPEKAQANPFMFVDTGLPEMLRHIFGLGCKKSRMIVKAAGCGQPLGNNEVFRIGDRNFTVLKKLLWKNNIMLKSKEVGGQASRTIHFDLSTGQVILSSKGERSEM